MKKTVNQIRLELDIGFFSDYLKLSDSRGELLAAYMRSAYLSGVLDTINEERCETEGEEE